MRGSGRERLYGAMTLKVMTSGTTHERDVTKALRHDNVSSKSAI